MVMKIKGMRRVYALAIVLIMTFGVVNTAWTAENGRTLVVFSVEGNYTTATRGTGVEFGARTGLRLGEGHTLATGSASSIHIRIDEESLVKMGQQSQVTVTQAGTNRLALTVDEGAALVNVQNQAPTHTLETRIGHTALTVRGTVFVIGYDEEGENVVITMLEGSGEINGFILYQGMVYRSNIATGESYVTEMNPASMDLFTLQQVLYYQDLLLEVEVIDNQTLRAVRSLYSALRPRNVNARRSSGVRQNTPSTPGAPSTPDNGGGAIVTPPTGPAAPEYGDGTASDPFQIGADDVDWLVANMNTTAGLAAHYVLTEDITLPNDFTIAPLGSNGFIFVAAGEDNPLGETAPFPEYFVRAASPPFTGTFDGDGNTINVGTRAFNGDYNINSGLFGHIGASGVVSNLTIAGTLTGGGSPTSHVGGLVAINEGEIVDVTTPGNLLTSRIAVFNIGVIRSVNNPPKDDTAVNVRVYQCTIGVNTADLTSPWLFISPAPFMITFTSPIMTMLAPFLPELTLPEYDYEVEEAPVVCPDEPYYCEEDYKEAEYDYEYDYEDAVKEDDEVVAEEEPEAKEDEEQETGEAEADEVEAGEEETDETEPDEAEEDEYTPEED